MHIYTATLTRLDHKMFAVNGGCESLPESPNRFYKYIFQLLAQRRRIEVIT